MAPAVDERLEPVLNRLRSDPTSEFGVDAAGGARGLSPSYFQRVFTAATGKTFRRYRLWLRMIQATRGLAEGHNLTRSAADAGFASASHFSDAVRLAFGFTATELFVGGLPVHLS